MYDVTRPQTFKSLEKWFQLMSEHGRGDVEVAVVSFPFFSKIIKRSIFLKTQKRSVRRKKNSLISNLSTVCFCFGSPKRQV